MNMLSGQKARSSKRFANFLVKYWLGLFTIAIFIFFSVIQPRFASMHNIMSMLSSTCILALVGMGVTFVMSVGEIDFSCGMELTGWSRKKYPGSNNNIIEAVSAYPDRAA